MSIRRIFLFLLVAVAFLAATGIPTNSQQSAKPQDEEQGIIAGRNVNMVSGTTLPGGDPWLQRQNEPSIAASTRNPLHLLAGANDYRTVDMPIEGEELPGLEEIKAAGDAWLGVFKSIDGGQSWTSTLLPGFPQDNSPEGLASPLKGYKAAADPVVRAGTNGLFYYSGIVFNRDTMEGAVFVARFIDNNNEESEDPIKYVDTIIVDQENGVRFKDKPWIATDVPRSSPPTITIDGQTIPCSNVFIAYSVFRGEEETLESKIIFRRSTDCGTTWKKPIELSTGHYLNQGASIAVDPKRNDKVYVAWRRFEKEEQQNAIVIALSENRGKSFHQVVEVASIPSGNSFDQPSSPDEFPVPEPGDQMPGTSFRTNSYPTMAIDNTGIAYLAWAQREGGPAGPARIILTTSENGIDWTLPNPVEIPVEPAHQFMPSLTFASGKLMLVWYDLRNDYAMLFSPWINDYVGFCDWRHTIDVRVTQGDPGRYPIFEPSKQVSRYIFHLYEDPEEPGSLIAYQGQFNPPNFPLFKGGTLPFLGDYIDITPSPMFVLDKNGHWRFNTEPSDTSVFHVVWTDNRDVRPPWDHDWTKYTPPISGQPIEYITDPSSWPYCNEGKNRPGMRNQNIYTSRITQGIEVGAPTNNKDLNLPVPRSFSIYVKNTTEYIKSFRLTIANQPPDGQASFLQFDFRDELDVSIAPYSTIARPIFIDSSDQNASVRIDVVEIDEPGGTLITDGLTSFILINADPTNPEATGDIQDKEEHKVTIGAPDVIYWSPHIRNEDYFNPHIRNPEVLNPDFVNPHIRNPDIVNPSILDPDFLDLTNPHIRNPHIRNPLILNPHIRNPHIRNFVPDEDPIIDIEWTVRNEGNTTSSYTFKTIAKQSPPEGIYLQLIVYREHFTPGIDGGSCALKQEPHHELLANILNPHIRNPHIRNLNVLDPEILNPAIENATFSIPPGEEVHVILRVVDTGPTLTSVSGLDSSTVKSLTAVRALQFNTFINSLGCTATSQGADSEDVEQGIEESKAAATILVIGTESPLSEGTIDEWYSKELTALGGTEPYEWWVDREKLPPGLKLNEVTGEIFGTPGRDETKTYPVTYSFTVQVTDSTLPVNQTDSQIYSLTIKEPYIPPPPLAITTLSLPAGALNTPYNFGLEASGGVPAYHWTLVSGSLPYGLTLYDNGMISGTPTTEGTFAFTVQVTDSEEPTPQTNTKSLSINVTPDSFTISGIVTHGDGGPPLPGVVIKGLPNFPITDENGFYSDKVAKGWIGTAVPDKAGYYFAPASEYYSNVGQDITTDYKAYLLTYTISGTVTFNGSPLPEVLMSGLPGSPETNENGYYISSTVEHGTSWTVTPTFEGYTFDPPSRSYDAVTYNQVNQDYTASPEEGYDPYEENDERENAWVITPDIYNNLQLLDNDWYKIYVTATDVVKDLKVTINGTLPNDIDVEIYYSSETRPLIAGISAAEKETVYVSGLKAGWYYINVPYWLGEGEGLQNSYSLTVDIGNFGLGEITGTVTDGTNGLDVSIWIYDIYGFHSMIAFTDANANGYYKISLPPGDYKLLFNASPVGDYYEGANYISEWYDDKPTFSRAEAISVEADDSIPIDVQLAEAGAISGTITDPEGLGLKGILVRDYDPEGRTSSYTWTDADGNYTLERLPTGNFKLRIRPNWGTYAVEWYNDKPSFEEGDTVPIQTTGVDVQLAEGGYIEGRVTDIYGTGIEGVVVNVYDSSQQIFYSRSGTDEYGYYAVPRLPTGDVKVYFNADSTSTNHASEWYDDKPNFDESTPVSVQAGETTFGIDAQLAEGGYIEGRVTDPNGDGLYRIQVAVFDLNGHNLRSAYTDENGNYTVNRVPSGDLRVRFRPIVGTYGVEWYSDKSSYNEADPVSVQSNQTTSGIDAQLAEGGYIKGRVTDTDGIGIEGILVNVYDNAQEFVVSYSSTDENGSYTVPRLPTGKVKVFFNTDFTDYVSEWYKNRNSFETAQLVSTTAGQTTSGIDAVLETKPPLTITTTLLPNGELAVEYNATLEATGGTEFYHWSLYSGSLPIGLAMDNKGVISGTPTVVGTSTFTVEVIDSSSAQKTATQELSITITSYVGPGLTISGTVAIGGVTPLEGALISGLPGDPATNADGFYTATVDYEWSGTVTPILSGYDFDPLSREYLNVTSDQVNQDYSAILPNYTISGTVAVSGSPLEGAEMNGLLGNPKTDENGYYIATVVNGWLGTVTPILNGYTFDPPSRIYDPVTYDQVNQDYAASIEEEYEDSYEPNNDRISAKVITPGPYPNLRLLDSDWYMINVGGADVGKDLKVTINGTLPNDMDVEIYYRSETRPLIAGISSAEKETVYVSNIQAGEYYIHVPYFWGGGLQNSYSLTVKIGKIGEFGLGEITGTVTDSTNGLNVSVWIYDIYGFHSMITFSDANANGDYKISLPPGDYKLLFNARPVGDYYEGANYISEWYDDKPTFSRAEAISVGAGDSILIDVQLAEAGAISGRITDPDGNGLEWILVRNYDPDGRTNSYAWTGADGNYILERLPTGNFKVRIRPNWGTYAVEWYDDRSSFEEGDTVPVQTSGVDVQLAEGGYIEGRVTDIYGNGIEGVEVNIYDSSQQIFYSLSGTDENGYYTVPRLPTGDVKVYFNANSTSANHASEWYDDKPNFDESTPVSVQAGETTSGIDAQLAEGGYIEGIVTDPGENGLYRIQVSVFDLNGHNLRSAYTDENGNYTVNRVLPGDLRVRFRPNAGTYGVEWYSDKSSYSEADPVSVQSNQTTSDIDAQLAEGGYIEGIVTNTDGIGIEGILVNVYDNAQEFVVSYSSTDENGEFTVPRMPTGRVKVYFNADYTNYVSEWYKNRNSFETAQSVSTTAGQTTSGVNAVLETKPPLSITTTSLPNGELAVEYSATLEATGGTEFYHWSLYSGSLPNGLTIDSKGVIRGTATAKGTSNFTVEVIDSSSPQQPDTQELSLTISPYVGVDHIISGAVTVNGSPLQGVVMNGLPGNPATNVLGEYTAVVSSGWSGTVTPILAGYYIDPVNRSYENLTSNQPDQNYTAFTAYTISGTVTINGPLQGVLMSGLPGDPRTNADGFYTAAVPTGWSGMVTPSLPGFTFDPPSRTYDPVISDQEDQDYTANYLGGQDDAYEENDDFNSASEITLGTYTDLVLLDEDWFKVYVAAADAGKDLKVHLKGSSYPDSNQRFDLDFQTYDGSGKLLSVNLSGGDDETIYITDLTEGWYYIGQTYIGQVGTVYSMTVEVSDNFGIGYISGRVTDEESGLGIEGVYVELYGDPFDWDISRPLITTDADGKYKVGFTPGNYTVRFNLFNNYHRDDRFPDVNYIGETYNSNEIVSIVAGTTVPDIDAELAPGGVITGRVTGPEGDGLNTAGVYVYASDTSRVSFAWTDENGYYIADRLRTGNYKVRFRPSYPYGDTQLGMKWYEDRGSFSDGLPVPVQVGSITSEINAQLGESGYIEGRVTDSFGDPIQGVSVVAYDAAGISLVSGGTDEDGNYRIWGRLPAGDVKIFFNATNAQGNYVSEYYTDKLLIKEADPVSVQPGQTTYGIDAQLADGGTITGRVTDSSGNGLQDISVVCFDIDSDNYYNTSTDGNGNYTLAHMLPDDYKVRFRPGTGNYAVQWYNDKNSFAEGDVVSVGAGETFSGIDAQLADNGGYLEGRVTDSYGGIEGVRVYARDSTKDATISWSDTDADGYYSVPRIPTCEAKVYFNADSSYLNYISEYYNDKSSYESADLVAATLGQTTPGINAVLATRPALNVTSTSIPNGELAVPYSASLQASGGREFYHWSLFSGALPNGLTLNGKGVISGTPTAIGTFNFTVQVSDSTNPQQFDSQSLRITIDSYIGTDFLISGTVTLYGSLLSGVVMEGLPGNPTTNDYGKYIALVPAGWSGTVTPILAGNSFDPVNRTYTTVASHFQNEDYTASVGYAISGTVTINGAPLQGVLMSGLPGDPRTNADGYYTTAVHTGWSGMVTPTLPGFAFDPANRSYSNVISDQADQDYTADFLGGQDDAYEENDDFNSASEITLGTYTDLVLLDEDWFKVYVGAADAGKILKVHIKGISYPDPNERKDLDFMIFNSSGKLLSYNLSGGDDETAYICDVARGWYYISNCYLAPIGAIYSLLVELGDNFGIGYISGRVTDEQSGLGIEGVYIELYGDPFDWDISRPLITTDVDGKYKIGYTPGNYTVRLNLFNNYHRDPYLPDVNYIGKTYNSNEIIAIVAGTTITEINAKLVQGGTITGRVTDSQGNGLFNATARVYASDNTQVSLGIADANGYFTAERMRTGNYKLRFRPPASSYNNYSYEWYENTYSFEDGLPVPVQAGSTTPNINAQLEDWANVEGYIEGRVTDSSGTPIQGIYVTAYDGVGYNLSAAGTNQDGTYRLRRLAPGRVKIFFNALNVAGNYVSEYYPDKFLIGEAAPVLVEKGKTTSGIDAQLAAGGTITGQVTDAQGNAYPGISVICFDIETDRYYATTTDVNGNYTLPNLFPDNYKVRFRPGAGNYAVEWYNDKGSFAGGDIVSVAAGAIVSGVDAQLSESGGFISGRVMDGGTGIEGVIVWVRDSIKQAVISSSVTAADGSYTVPCIPTCDAKVYFNADSNYLNCVSEYYNDQSTFETANLVPTVLGEITQGIDAVLAAGPALTITTESLPSGEIGVPYSTSLQASGGREFYYWSLFSGTLPDGLTLYSNGVISGTPTATGFSDFTVQITDSSQTQLIDTQSLNITIDVYSGPGHLISGVVLFEGSPLPGVVMDGLPGNPTTSAQGKYIIPVTPGWSGVVRPTKTGYFFDPENRIYTDVTSHQPSQDYTAYELTLNIITDWLPNGTEGYPYSQTLEAEGGSGPATYSWSLVSGLLPYGLTLDSNGVISGTSTNPDTYDFTVRVTDSSSPGPQIVEKSFSINIHWAGMVSDAPILYWKLNEGEGTTAQDSSGHEANGTLRGNAAYTNVAKEGYAVETYGQGSIDISREEDFYFADEATIMAYVKIDDLDEEERFVWKLQYEHPVLGHPYSIEIHMNINGNFLNLDSGNGLKEDIFNCQHFQIHVDLSNSNNGFILVDYNQIALTIKDDLYTVFINGNEVASEQGAVFEVNDNIQCFWVMGAGWSEYSLEGKIDELAVYNRILSPGEVAQHYQAGPMFLISGMVTLDGSPLPWVRMEGLPGNPSTNENGEYIAPVLPGWPGTVTPNRGGYYFDPQNRTYEDVTSNMEGEDYTAYERGSLWITTDWLPDGTKNSSYKITLEAADGIEPYSWSLASGSLPNGLTLNSLDSNGEISGTPTEAGNFSLTVRVVDSNTPQQAATQEFSLYISPEHQGFWNTTYPGGGAIHSMGLAIDPADPNVLYATAQNRGIFKTTDAGSSWTNLIDDPDWPYGENDYPFFIIHRTSGNYYLCSRGRIYMSSNKGLNWNQIYEREDWDINALDIAPSNADFIYFGTRDGEMFRTTDGGANWSACDSSGLPAQSIDIITADPNTPSTVYAGTESGIYKSTASGDIWISIDNNFDFEWIEDIEIDPFDSKTIYIQARADGYGHQIFKSSTGEASWTNLINVGGGLWDRGNCIAIDRNDTQKIYVAIHESILKTIDGGSNWTEHAVSSTVNESIIIDLSNPLKLYVGTHGEGVYKSEDGGVTWNAVNNGIRALSSPGVGHSLEFDESNPNYIYAGTLGGGYRSLDGGATWEKMDFPQGNMTAILTHPSTAGTVYAVHNSFWKRTYDVQNGSWLDSSWVDPTDPQFCCVPQIDLGIASYDSNIILYLGAKHSDDPQSGVYRSDNGGVTWTLKNNGLTHTDVRAIAVHPANHQVVFAGTEWEWPLDPNKDYGLYKTTDGGEYWDYISCGLPSSMYIHQILIYPDDPNTMYLTGGGEGFCGLFKSEDGGECWEQVSNNCANSIAVAPDNPDLLYIGHWEGFYVSLNGGSSWMEFNDGLPRNPQVSSIHLDPTDPFHVFIATGAGVYEATFFFDFMITTEWLPSGIVDESYSTTLEAAGGTASSWEIVSGSLPDGLTLNTTSGEISGIPPVAGTWDFVVKATDSSPTPKIYTKELTLTIHNAYTLSVSANPAEGGSVSKDPDEPKYVEGSIVDVSVTVDPLYSFIGWSGDASGRATFVHVEMTRDKTLTANFALTTGLPDYTISSYTLPTAADAGQIIGGSVSVTVENQGASDPYAGDISVGVYLSSDSVITTSDILLWRGRSSIKALGMGGTTNVIIDPDLQIPTTVSAGSYYIGVLVDESDIIAERHEINNYSSQPISITTTGTGHLEMVGAWPYGSFYDIKIDEARKIALVADGGVLRILNVSDPSNPIKISELALTPGWLSGITISGDYAYIANGPRGLTIVDISDPSNPTEIGSCETSQIARTVRISGNYAYVTDHLGGLRVIDISDPSAPSEVSFLSLPGITRGIEISGNYAYLTGRPLGDEGTNCLRVIDISNPLNPYQISFYEVPGATGWPDIYGNYVFVPSWGDGLRIIDVADPYSPFEAAFYEGAPYLNGVTVNGNYAFLPDNDQYTLIILELSDLNNLTGVPIYSLGETPSLSLVEIVGNYAFVTCWQGYLRILDISDLYSPVEIGSYDEFGGLSWDADVSNDYAYLINWKGSDERLKILDISNLSQISETTTYHVPYTLEGIKASGNYAYLAAYTDGLRVIDVSNPASPQEVGSCEESRRARNVAISGNYAYVADGPFGLRIIDISTPSSPFLVSTWDTPWHAYDVAISGNYVYVADSGSGLRIINISDPLNPWEVGFYQFGGTAYRVAVSEGYAYVVDLNFGLRIIDVSNPESPFEVSFIRTFTTRDVAVSGNVVFMAVWGLGLKVIDVSDHSNPVEIDEHGFLNPYSVFIHENRIYLVDRESGFYIFEFRLPGP